MKKTGKKHFIGWFLGLMAAVFMFLFLVPRAYRVQIQPEAFQQSARELINPDRGFYSVRGFRIARYPQDFEEEIANVLYGAQGRTLIQLQINLRTFRSEPLSSVALRNVETLLQGFSGSGKRLLLRFLYDWDGKASLWEPDRIEQILEHMQQLQPLLHQYDADIFLLQGLFTGNWGEMNHTAYSGAEDLQRLAVQLAASAGQDTFLSVRTPAQWRRIAGTEDYAFLRTRLGLFNDGMLGNSLDCGTYAPSAEAALLPDQPWPKLEELAFQEDLCSSVPNGGEVILDNPCNDLEAAIRDMRTMHVTYLNWEYDRNVLQKWEETPIEEPRCFAGKNGLEYIAQHLGYRLHIDKAELRYHFLTNCLTVGAWLKNTGFAPMYSGKDLTLTLCGERQILTWRIPKDIRCLTGGNDGESQFFGVQIPVTKLQETQYDVFLDVWDPVTQQPIALANVQEPQQYGYELGHISFAVTPVLEWLHQKR